MRTVPADEAAKEWRKLVSQAEREPVKVIGGDMPDVVVMSEAQYSRLRGEAWDRLMGTIHALQDEAARRGLTGAELEKLLADED